MAAGIRSRFGIEWADRVKGAVDLIGPRAAIDILERAACRAFILANMGG